MEQLRTSGAKSSRRPRQTLHNSRYSARYLILVYTKTPERFDTLEIQRLVTQEQGRCTIVRRVQADDTSSYLAFVDFAGKRFQTRNLGLFDIQGHHPKWLHVRSSPWNTLANLTASGEVVWSGISRDKKTAAQSESTWSANKSASPSGTQWKLLGSSSNEGNILELCKKYIASHDSNTSEATELLQPTCSDRKEKNDRTGMSHIIEFWKEGYRSGYADGASHNKGGQNANLIPHESLPVGFLPDVTPDPQQPDNFGEEAVPQDPIDEMLALDSWSPDDFESLDWECTEFSATAFPFPSC